MPPNGKITWGYFASRRKLATANSLFLHLVINKVRIKAMAILPLEPEAK